VKRSMRADIARQTVEIVEQGHYRSSGGQIVDIGGCVQACLDATRLFVPEELKQIRHDVLIRPAGEISTVIEVVNETTLAGLARVLSSGTGPVAVMNFASAKNPGGGFLSGSQAQEESLARSSALQASLLRCWNFYERHRASPSLLYSDAMILSPDCPVFRDDEGTLFEEPQLATFITSAAPNAGAAAKNRPEELRAIPDVFLVRSEYVLALAASRGCRQLVLGAWGCGVFRNDPAVVAAAFSSHLRGAWAGRFKRIVFAVLDTSPTHESFSTFQRHLGPAS